MDNHEKPTEPLTSATESLARLIADLDLESLPERLDDQQLEMVRKIAMAPLPCLPPCSERHFAKCLRVMLAVLPRQNSDDLAGELFVEAYRRQLGDNPDAALSYLAEQATRTCRWFPTIVECIEILSGWRRSDADVLRRQKASILASRERSARHTEMDRWERRKEMLWTRTAIDGLPESLIAIGLQLGEFHRDADGVVQAERMIDIPDGF